MMPARLLICTDLDRTLIPNGPQPESSGARRHFAVLASRAEVILVYVSGRHRELLQAAIRDYDLPQPEFALGDVGTTIYRVGSGHAWHSQAEWEQEIARDWNGSTHGDLRRLLEDLAGLRPQEESRQNTCKLSYYLPLDIDREALARQIEARLEATGAAVRLVWSVDEPAALGLLDILPARASKLHAIHALMRKLGFSDAETVFCGDSGNDLDVLCSAIPAVLVANSSAQVRAQAQQLARAAGNARRLYIAQGNFMGLNGNYAAGMLEGIAHYHPDSLSWMGFDGVGAGA